MTKLNFVGKRLFLCIGLAFILIPFSYATEHKTVCLNVYHACLKDTGQPENQILMGVRGMCHDQQHMCQLFQKKLKSCIKDYGIKACKRIYQIKMVKE